jgi:hypothetical protein
MADIKIADLELGTVLGADDAVVLVQGDVTLQVKGQDIAWGVKTLADLADKAYVDAIVAGAPELLDTLNELAAAIGDDPNFASSIRTILDSKLPTVNFGLEFWNALAEVTTFHVTEDTNLYYTEQRVLDVVIPLVPTSIFDLDVPEVSVNLPGYLHYNGTTLSWESSTNPTFTSVTATQLNVQNVAFTGTGAVTIASGNDLNFAAVGDITFNGDTLSTVATSGSYNDLTSKPTLFSGSYNDLTSRPTLFSGSYNDLTNKPTIVEKTAGSWTLVAGANTVSLTVPGPGTYSIWVNGNIPNGIVTYTATVVVTNTNVPVVGNSYGWYYAAGNALVLTAIPDQVVGTANGISTAVVATTTANVFTFGITNNSGSDQVVNWGYTKL